MPMPVRRMKDVLRCPEKQNCYDETDLMSIFRYAQGIEGKTFLQILQEAGLTTEEIEWVRSKEGDKGLPGKIVEASYFGYELNSRQEADFDAVGAELKTTAADYDDKTSRYRSGETISVTQIDFNGPVEDDFYASHLYDKLKMLIVIFYHRNKALASKLLYKVFFANLFRPSEEDLAIIRSDYREITDKIRIGHAHLLSRSDGTYLSTAPKARRSSNMISPFYGGPDIVKRSYTLRKEYVNVILNDYYEHPTQEERLITDLRELERMSFTQIIQSRFAQYIGQNIWSIARTLNLQSEGHYDTQAHAGIPIGVMNKSTLSKITARMLGLSSLRSEEFTKAGIVVKTILFNKRGNNKEKFRLGDADFMEIHTVPPLYRELVSEDDENMSGAIHTGWEYSELFALLDALKYLCVVFQETPEGEIVFKGTKLWALSDEDIEQAELDWIDIKNVLANGVQLTIGNDGRTYNNFPGVKDARRIHLRPHGEKAFYVDSDGSSWGNGCINDTELLPDGRRMTRQSYWLNNSFVREQVRDLVDIYE